MKAVILAGGAGTRLRPVTYEIPKPLVPVRKKPILNHLIEFLAKHGVDDVAVLISKAHADDFKRWQKAWADELPHRKVSIFAEDFPRGTFGGLERLREWIGNEPFVLSNGDELKDFDLSALKDFHASQKGALGTIALVRVEKPQEYGVPVMEETRIREFLEKPQNPPSNFVSSGIYVLDPEIFVYADFSKPVLMIEKDIFPRVAKEGKLHGVKLEGRWFDCGTLERWEKAMQEW